MNKIRLVLYSRYINFCILMLLFIYSSDSQENVEGVILMATVCCVYINFELYFETEEISFKVPFPDIQQHGESKNQIIYLSIMTAIKKALCTFV